MKHYTNSDYALNKNSAGIVYDFADGAKEVTFADFLADYPGATPSDFAALKAWSDEDYLKRDRHGYNTTYKDMNLEWADLAGKCRFGSPEDTLIANINTREESERRGRKVALVSQALDSLTDVQRRRHIMYHVDGRTVREIAASERVKHQSVVECLAGAEKKIRKFLARNQKTE